MELTKDNAAVCLNSIEAQDRTINTSEIDLYDELIAYAELPPAEQLRLVDQTRQPESTSAESIEGHAVSEPVQNQVLVESATAVSQIERPTGETSAATLDVVSEAPQTEELEPVATEEPVEYQTASQESATRSTEIPGDVRTPSFTGSRLSGPLSGFNLPPEIVYTGAMSFGVCIACGAESGVDDLFCLTCGVFIDEVGSTLPASPPCGECKRRIEADEIFCPWCGSAVPA